MLQLYYINHLKPGGKCVVMRSFAFCNTVYLFLSENWLQYLLEWH